MNDAIHERLDRIEHGLLRIAAVLESLLAKIAEREERLKKQQWIGPR